MPKVGIFWWNFVDFHKSQAFALSNQKNWALKLSPIDFYGLLPSKSAKILKILILRGKPPKLKIFQFFCFFPFFFLKATFLRFQTISKYFQWLYFHKTPNRVHCVHTGHVGGNRGKTAILEFARNHFFPILHKFLWPMDWNLTTFSKLNPIFDEFEVIENLKKSKKSIFQIPALKTPFWAKISLENHLFWLIWLANNPKKWFQSKNAGRKPKCRKYTAKLWKIRGFFTFLRGQNLTHNPDFLKTPKIKKILS